MSASRPRPVVAALVALLLLVGCADLEPPDLDGPDTPPVSEGSEPDVSESSEPDVEDPGIGEFESRSLDGGGNNVENPQLGQVGGNYRRVGTAAYGDGGAPRATVPVSCSPSWVSATASTCSRSGCPAASASGSPSAGR